MQTVMAFISSAFSSGASATAATAVEGSADAAATAASTAATAVADAGGAASFGSTAAAAAGWGSKVLGALKVGSTAVAALSVFGQSDLQATAMRQEAQDENLQAQVQFTQGAQAADDIARQYNLLVQQQMAVASADGIDVASGSVTDARALAEQEADRQTSIIRSGAQMNAALRMGRASLLQGAATQTEQMGGLSALAKVGNAAVQYGNL